MKILVNIDNGNDNDRRLVGFATLHGMMVGGTLFPYKDIHVASWKSPTGTHRNQIEHGLASV
jgi:hypothetical protein